MQICKASSRRIDLINHKQTILILLLISIINIRYKITFIIYILYIIYICDAAWENTAKVGNFTN